MSEKIQIIPVPETVQQQMPDHIEPGSLLAQIRCPISIIWSAIEAIGLDQNPTIYRLFYQHLNDKHFGQ